MTSKLRVSEIYLSIQGEGPRVGAPTVFVRFAGCNLRCPGWACDTPHAIDPKIYQKDSRLLAVEDILAEIEEVAPDGANICYTGGEPFLQNSQAFQSLILVVAGSGYPTQEAFTNGTITFPSTAYDYLYFVMDYKLTGAGEAHNIQNVPKVRQIRIDNIAKMNDSDVVKFTIASRQDYEEAREAYSALSAINPDVNFIYGVVWGKLEAQELIAWVLADHLVEWTYSHQLHNVIWDRTKRGI